MDPRRRTEKAVINPPLVETLCQYMLKPKARSLKDNYADKCKAAADRHCGLNHLCEILEPVT